MAEAEIGVIGMGGEANPLEGGAQIELDTPYGKTSAPITIGDLDGKSVAFLPRRGEHRELPPPQIPYRANVRAMKELGVRRIVGGTVVVIQGPRFSTRAESELYRMVGWDVVDMITYPECHLARELELCYAHIGMVTDYDIGVQGAGAVTGASIARVSAQNADRLMRLLRAAVPSIGPQPQDDCATALALADI